MQRNTNLGLKFNPLTYCTARFMEIHCHCLAQQRTVYKTLSCRTQHTGSLWLSSNNPRDSGRPDGSNCSFTINGSVLNNSRKAKHSFLVESFFSHRWRALHSISAGKGQKGTNMILFYWWPRQCCCFVLSSCHTVCFNACMLFIYINHFVKYR